MLSHETALELHEICDVKPEKVHVTVPKGYRLRRQTPDWLVVHSEDLRGERTSGHEGMPMVRAARAIIGSIANGVDSHIIEQAVSAAVRLGRVTTAEREKLDRVYPPKA